MSRIILDRVLPRVFAGMDAEAPVRDSALWLRTVELIRPARYLIEAESGTGKSSLISFIYGSRDDYDGSIFFDDVPARTLSVDQWSRMRTDTLALLPQEMRLFPELTVMDNILIKNRLTDYKSGREIEEMLERVELQAKTSAYAGRLSVGQQQRVAIVRALCQPFGFLLLDEPVSHLDARNNAVVAAMIADEAATQSASIISTSVGNPLAISGAEVIRL
ncbi:MAG: ATP-binding cassette domain-containing protein [Muribaculaceae bacterium]|nr:ATP-binding cassette domain-containing protein [Muribaculaceae bacterium]